MDQIWDRKAFRSLRSLAIVAGMKKLNDHAEPTKSNTNFFKPNYKISTQNSCGDRVMTKCLFNLTYKCKRSQIHSNILKTSRFIKRFFVYVGTYLHGQIKTTNRFYFVRFCRHQCLYLPCWSSHVLFPCITARLSTTSSMFLTSYKRVNKNSKLKCTVLTGEIVGPTRFKALLCSTIWMLHVLMCLIL